LIPGIKNIIFDNMSFLSSKRKPENYVDIFKTRDNSSIPQTRLPAGGFGRFCPDRHRGFKNMAFSII
jgi:hypothetical protein